MQHSSYYLTTQSLRAHNLNVFVYSVYESIVLDHINIAGLSNLSLEIKNNSASGNIIDVSTYGSPNEVDYFPIENNLFNATIGPGEFKHVEFNVTTGFLRVTIRTDANINVNVYMHGNLG